MRTLETVEPLYFPLSQFLYREAALLDEQDWDGWGRLFTADGVYWMPAARSQADPVNHVSLIHDNSLLREIRLGRLKNADATSLQVKLNTSHLVSNIILAEAKESLGRYTLRSRFVVAQHASWGTRTFHGRYTHELVRNGDSDFSIALKRVDLVDVESPLGDILTIL
jgi:3-phenylpropionate/cinnamic acid dioxygenase small subunit